MDEQPATEPSRAELLDLYKVAIDEYRFQVNLNWSRTQYYLVLNFGILGLATGILQLAKGSVGVLVAGLYLAGAACSVLSLAAAAVQQGYYQTARSHKALIERRLELGGLSLATTPGMGSALRRVGKVTTFNSVLLTTIAVMDLVGAVVVVVGVRST